MKRKLGIYARQSRDKGTGGSIEDQILKGKMKADELGFDFEVYTDRGESASSDNFDNRPEFKRLLEDIEKKAINDVFVFDISRLTRNDYTNFLIKKVFKEHNVTVYTQIEGATDFANNEALLINDIKALFNMKFARDTALKIKSVLKNNAEKGRAPSGVIRPFGYTSDANKMLAIESEEAKIVVEIYNLCLNGYGSGTIAKVLNEKGVHTKTHRLILQNKLGQVEGSSFSKTSNNPFKKWAPNTVLSILKNPLYKGKRLHVGEEFNAPAIIDEYKWEQVQNQIKKNQNAPGLSKHKYLLKNLCICGRCGSNFCGRTRPNKKDHYYYCSSRKKTIGKCGIRSINIDTLESLIWMIISTSDIVIGKAKEEVDKLKNPTYIQELLKDKAAYKTKINSLAKSRDNILSLVDSEHVTFDDAKKQLAVNKAKTNEFNKMLSEIDLKLRDQDYIARSIDYAQQFLKDWDRLAFTDDFELKYTMVRLFIDKVTIDFDDIEEIYTVNVSAKLPDANNLHTLKLNIDGSLIEEKDGSNDKGGRGNNNSNKSLKSSNKSVSKTKGDASLKASDYQLDTFIDIVPPKGIPLPPKWYGAGFGTVFLSLMNRWHLAFRLQSVFLWFPGLHVNSAEVKWLAIV
jgi:site-specific DNA recombinase